MASTGVQSLFNSVNSATINGKSSDPISVLDSGALIASNVLEFPSSEDLTEQGQFTLFSFYKWEGVARSLATTTDTIANFAHTSIALPLPGNLGTAYNVEWENAEGGALTAAAIQAGQTLFDSRTQGFTQTGVETLNNIMQGAVGFAATALGKSALGRIAGASVGRAVNPQNVVLFRDVPFREHEFSYRFSPKSLKESETLRDVIGAFKYFMNVSVQASPADESGLGEGVIERNLFTYPDFFTIDYIWSAGYNNGYLYSIAPSVLKSLDVQFHPNSIPSYSVPYDSFGVQPAPTEVTISMRFQETDIITRERIAKANR